MSKVEVRSEVLASTDMIDRVAGAIALAREGFTDSPPAPVTDYDRDLARHAIAAMREPTEIMLYAVNRLTAEVSAETRMLYELGHPAQAMMLKHKARWRRMISAALGERPLVS